MTAPHSQGSRQPGPDSSDPPAPGGAPGTGTPHIRRVIVAHPRTLASLRNPRPPVIRYAPVTDDLRRQTPLGDIYLRSLMRAQLRLALAVVGLLVALLGALPYLIVALPGLREGTVVGIPVPWLVIGGAVYPVILALAVVHIRQARRNERDFTDLVERS